MTPPQAYKFCDAHMRPNMGPNRCNECFSPNTNPESIPTPPSPVSGAAPQVSSVSEQPRQAVTDPEAQKIIQAAQSYAQTVEAVAIISAQVKDCRETLVSLKNKLRETKRAAKEKLEIMQGKKTRKRKEKLIE